ncbi:MAG TPA: FxLYD domain-containing protein [Candidatus Hypogeohydataceae bacterium YC41]
MKYETRWNIPLAFLYLFLFLGASDPQAIIMEKLTALEETLHELAQRLERLEKRVTNLEKGTTAQSPKPSKAPSPTPKKMPTTIDLGGGLSVVNLNFKPAFNDTVFTGELENGSSRDFQFVLFNVDVLDSSGKVLGTSPAYVMDIPMGSSRPFEVTIYGVNAKDIGRYVIKYVKGS